MNQSDGTGQWFVIVAVGVAIYWTCKLSFKCVKYFRRRRALIEKYGEEIGLRILEGTIWQGMTAEQLTDTRGNPVDVDTKVMKTKSRETWKYSQTGKNRFNERIYLEDDVVVGWKEV